MNIVFPPSKVIPLQYKGEVIKFILVEMSAIFIFFLKNLLLYHSIIVTGFELISIFSFSDSSFRILFTNILLLDFLLFPWFVPRFS